MQNFWQREGGGNAGSHALSDCSLWVTKKGGEGEEGMLVLSKLEAAGRKLWI